MAEHLACFEVLAIRGLSHSYSVDDSSNAAFLCQYCSSLLLGSGYWHLRAVVKGTKPFTSFLWSLPVDEESLLPVLETSAVSL